MSRIVSALLLVSLVSGACEGREPGAEPAGEGAGGAAVDTFPEAGLPAGPPRGGDAPAERPSSRRDTIFLEGTPEVTELTLVRSPAGFDPPFSTYVPEEIVPVSRDLERGMEMRFVAAFAGVRNEEASLAFYFHPPGTAEDEAREEARSVVRAYGGSGEPIRPGRWEWSRVEYTLGDGAASGVVGAVAVGRRGDRWFRVLLRYPPEYGDGFAPRAALILDAWRWEDTVEGLGGEPDG